MKRIVYWASSPHCSIPFQILAAYKCIPRNVSRASFVTQVSQNWMDTREECSIDSFHTAKHRFAEDENLLTVNVNWCVIPTGHEIFLRPVVNIQANAWPEVPSWFWTCMVFVKGNFLKGFNFISWAGACTSKGATSSFVTQKLHPFSLRK